MENFNLTMVRYGGITVEAEDKEEAIAIANDAPADCVVWDEDYCVSCAYDEERVKQLVTAAENLVSYFQYHNKNITKKQEDMIDILSDALHNMQ